MKRRTEITIKTDRLIIVSRNPCADTTAWCENCGVWIKMLTLDEAAAIFRVSPQMICHLVDSQQIHFKETPTGRLLICPNSLF